MEKKINHWYEYTNNWKDNYGKDFIEWKGTPGIGDAMYGLNIAHMRAFVNQKPTTLVIHWYHSQDYLYHFEDPETIIERIEYLHSRYLWPSMVNLEHVFNSSDKQLYVQRYRNVFRYNGEPLARYWSFDTKFFTTPKLNKIVIWRPSFNADHPRFFKLPLISYEWLSIINDLKNLDFEVVEIDYRTPVSEVFYHIRTAEFLLSYEGMWHYVGKNFFKPHMVLSDDPITKWHTPFSVIKNQKTFDIITNIHKIRTYIHHGEILQQGVIRRFNRLVFNDENRPRSY